MDVMKLSSNSPEAPCVGSHPRRLAQRLALFIAAICLGLACSSSCKDANRCEQDSDCFAGEVCYRGTCAPGASDGGADGGDADADDGAVDEDGSDGEVPHFIEAAAGTFHTCGLLSTGRVMCWGECSEGQCGGDIEESPRVYPTMVEGLDGVVSLDAGYNYTCAVLDDQTARCFGTNQFEQISPDNDENKPSPTDVGLTGVTMIRPAQEHTCAVTESSGVHCWGEHATGENATPSGLEGATWVGTGQEHTCAVSEGRIRCWGDDSSMQLGNGNPWIEGISNAETVEGGWYHTCALLEDTTVRCWGGDNFDQLGDEGGAGTDLPVRLEDLSGVFELDVGDTHTCVRLDTGGVECWGSDLEGFRSEVPTEVHGLSSDIVDVSVGGNHACAVNDDGEMYCWGVNTNYVLGDQTETYRSSAVKVQFRP
jgi:alpha-tubulin suppressor-like RCC1 family protein